MHLLSPFTVGVLFATMGSPGGDTPPDVAGLVRNTEKANQALVRGDIDEYVALTRHAKDYALMNPFGGAPSHGFEDSPERRAGMKQFFKSGTLKQEVVATFASDDLVVLVTIEHMHGEAGGLPEQDWTLRVTQVFRRDGSEWQLVHRHADPLGNKITVPQAAALARGSLPSN
ncbi:MAG TPA: nuclear transport factor 2 family protein [Thermoanaerobaculia bacterium]